VPLRPRQVLTLLLAVAVVLASFVLVGDLRGVGHRLGGFRWWAFAAAIGLALTNYGLRFVRWHLYLRHRAVLVPVATSALVFLAGFSMAVTPGKLGELVKSYLLRALRGIPVARTAGIVITERVNDLLALLILATIGVVTYGVGREAALATAVLVGAAFVFLLWHGLARRTIDVITRPRRLARLRPRLHEIYDSLSALGQPRPVAWSTALAVAAWTCEGMGFALIVNAFPGAHVDPGLAMLIYAATTIAGALSFLPGGLGVTEGAMTLLLVEHAAGVDRGTATAATILTRLATLWLAVAIGFVALGLARRRAPDAVLTGPAPADP
jgi:uncharacterized protein (TIRG00374 family)